MIAYEQIKATLAPHGYTLVISTFGFWKHNTPPTKFCLFLDDFVIKKFSKPNAQHLLNVISRTYSYATYWDGKNYRVLTINWKYTDGYVDISMRYHVNTTLSRLQHSPKVSSQYSLHAHIKIQFSTKNTRQYATAQYTSPHLPLQ